MIEDGQVVLRLAGLGRACLAGVRRQDRVVGLRGDSRVASGR